MHKKGTFYCIELIQGLFRYYSSRKKEGISKPRLILELWAERRCNRSVKSLYIFKKINKNNKWYLLYNIIRFFILNKCCKTTLYIYRKLRQNVYLPGGKAIDALRWRSPATLLTSSPLSLFMPLSLSLSHSLSLYLTHSFSYAPFTSPSHCFPLSNATDWQTWALTDSCPCRTP